MKSLSALTLCILLAGVWQISPGISHTTNPQTRREQARRALDSIRGVNIEGLEQTQIEEINRRLDSAWDIIRSAGLSAVPLLVDGIQAEVSKPGKPDYFFLFDVSRLLQLIDPGNHWELIATALARIDPDDHTMLANATPYFRLAHQLARTGRPEAIPALLPFLRVEKTKAFVPQHALELDAGLMCAFLFGSYGSGAEDILLGRLISEPQERLRILETLGWIGAERSLAPVAELYQRETAEPILARAFFVLVTHGGEGGRKVLRETPVADKEAAFRNYYAGVEPALHFAIYEEMGCTVKMMGRPKFDPRLSREELDQLLSQLEADRGQLSELETLWQILDRSDETDLPRLVRIRNLAFHRLSDEALHDVKALNAVIAAVKAKPAVPSVSALKQRAEAGDGEAQFRLSLRYLCALGVQADSNLSKTYLEAAVKLGYVPALRFLAAASRPADEFPEVEVSIIHGLRRINIAALSYSQTYENGYPPTLVSLGPTEGTAEPNCQAADLIDSLLASGQYEGYVIDYELGPRVKQPDARCPPGADTYTLGARPVKYTEGARSFFTDQSGVIRATKENRAATAQDPPIDR